MKIRLILHFISLEKRSHYLVLSCMEYQRRVWQNLFIQQNSAGHVSEAARPVQPPSHSATAAWLNMQQKHQLITMKGEEGVRMGANQWTDMEKCSVNKTKDLLVICWVALESTGVTNQNAWGGFHSLPGAPVRGYAPAPGLDFYCSTACSRKACLQPLGFATEISGEKKERTVFALLNLNCKAWFYYLTMLRCCRQKMALSLTSVIWLEGSMPSDISLHKSNYWVCLMLVKLLEINFEQIFLFAMDSMQRNCETNSWS